MPLAAAAQEFNLRATANSNENDEDYDGLIVFKNFVEQASNGAIGVEIFMGTQLCSNGAECLQGVADAAEQPGQVFVQRSVPDREEVAREAFQD